MENWSMTRNTKLKFALGGVVVPIAIALAAGGMRPTVELTGESYALYAQTSTGSLPRTAHAILPLGGGIASSEAADVNLAGIVEATALDASITGVGDISDAS